MSATTTDTGSLNTVDSTFPRLEVDFIRLSSLLSENTSDDSEGIDDIKNLLEQLESVDGMAKGVEGRLDDIIGNLDTLLTSLRCKEKGAVEGGEKGIENTSAASTARAHAIPE